MNHVMEPIHQAKNIFFKKNQQSCNQPRRMTRLRNKTDSQLMENEWECIQQVLEGNRPAFSALVSHYQSYVFTICWRILKSKEEAEEAAQDVFVKVFKTLKTFKQDSKFSTWLYAVAYRTAIDHSRKKRMKSDSIDNEDKFIQIKDDASNPLEMTEGKNLKSVLKSVVATLPETEAGIVTLYYQGEMSVKEIAKSLNLTESNVKVKLYRTREVLKNKLSRYLRAEVKDLL